MNPSQERIGRNFAAKEKKALKDVQTGSGAAHTSRSGNSSLGQATIALSPAQVSSKAKKPRVKGSVDLTVEKGKVKYDLPPAGWRGLSSRALLFNFSRLSLFTPRVWIARKRGQCWRRMLVA